jgi:septum formation protein
VTESAGVFHGKADDGKPMNSQAPLYLASASLRRQRILERLGVPFRVHVTDVEEVAFETDPEETARVNALAKLRATQAVHAKSPIIAADTVLEFEGRCIGKPASMYAAREFLRSLSAQTHRVLTGVALWPDGDEREPTVTVCETIVHFRDLSEEDIDTYIRIVNPLDKAGAYDIDQSGEMIVESVEGSRTNVMGLPVEVVEPWLKLQRLL